MSQAEDNVSKKHFSGKSYDKLTNIEKHEFDYRMQQELLNEWKEKREVTHDIWHKMSRKGDSGDIISTANAYGAISIMDIRKEIEKTPAADKMIKSSTASNLNDALSSLNDYGANRFWLVWLRDEKRYLWVDSQGYNYPRYAGYVSKNDTTYARLYLEKQMEMQMKGARKYDAANQATYARLAAAGKQDRKRAKPGKGKQASWG